MPTTSTRVSYLTLFSVALVFASPVAAQVAARSSVAPDLRVTAVLQGANVAFTRSLPVIDMTPSSRVDSQQIATDAPRDVQGLAVLTQAITVAGGASALGAVHDFTASGSITYSWAGKQVSGPAKLYGLGVSLFRLDTQLPDGSRSWLVTDTQGSVKNTDGTTRPIQYANAIHLGSLTFPYARMIAALDDSSFSISIVGTKTVNGRQGTEIEVRPTFSATEDPSGDLAKLNTEDYVIDLQTFAILETQNTMWSEDGRMRPIDHEVVFSNFSTVNGLTVPFSITEKFGGQLTWSLRLNSISFNGGLTASMFQF